MSLKIPKTRGFIGLLALLICVAIVMILMFSRGSEGEGENKKSDQSVIETQLEAVQKAEDAKKTMESRSYNIE